MDPKVMFRSIEDHFCHKVGMTYLICLVLVVKYQLNKIHDWNWSAEEKKQGRKKLPKSGWASSNVYWEGGGGEHSLPPLVDVLIC